MAGMFLPPVVTVLQGDISDLVKKVEEAKALIKSLGTLQIQVGFDLSGASGLKARAQAAALASRVNIPVGMDISALSGAKIAGIAALQREARLAEGGSSGGGGRWGGIFGWLGKDQNLFGGGGDSKPGFLKWMPDFMLSAANWHFALDGVAESLAVVLPAVIGLGIWGAVAAPVIGDMATHLKDMYTVTQATGKVIAPLTGGLHQLSQAVQPSVYQLYGDAVSVINNKLGDTKTIAVGVGSALDQLGARAAVALKGSGFSGFMANAAKDVSILGNIFGNVFGTIGSILKSLPGYAQPLFETVQRITGGIEDLANSGVTQGIMKVGFAFHGAWIWGGLFANLIGKGISSGLRGVSSLALNSAAKLEGMGAAGAKASKGLFAVADGAEQAASLPWGWIAAAGIGIGILAYKMLTAKDATQQFVASMQQSLSTLNAGTGYNKLLQDQVVNTNMLAQAQKNLGAAQAQATQMGVVPAAQMYSTYNSTLATASADVRTLQGNQQNLSGQQVLYNSRINDLAKSYGGVKAAQGLLVLSGVSMGQFLTKNKNQWQQVQQEVLATSLALQQMGQRGGKLGSDLAILDQQASDTYTAMTQLNQAWQTFMGLSTGAQTTFQGLEQGLRTLRTQMRAAGASFTGVNANSITLQQTFSGQITSLQNLIGTGRQANASNKQMADVLSQQLTPAVHDGALANAGFRQQIYDLAVQAGYTGRDTIAGLTGFVNRYHSSAQQAENITNGWSAALGKIPKNIPVTITVLLAGNGAAYLGSTGHATYTVNPGGNGYAGRGGGHARGTLGAAPGWAMVGENGPELMHFSGGEKVVPHENIHGYGAGGGSSPVVVEAHLYLDGKEIFADVKQETQRYNKRNGNRRRGGRVPGVMVPR